MFILIFLSTICKHNVLDRVSAKKEFITLKHPSTLGGASEPIKKQSAIKQNEI